MGQIDQHVDTNSILREFARDTISLDELYQRFHEKEVDYKIYVVKEDQYPETDAVELVGILGSGRSCYVFLGLLDKKLVSLRLSYDEGDFEDKFDSVRVEMGEDYDQYFLNILFPAVPVGYLYLGSVKKRQKLFFDKKVYASFWEKADATLTMKLGADIEKKLKWFLECLQGLRLIHARKRAHFDIKLENLFLVDHHLKIGDFEYYLKIEDFIRSNIHFCGTPGHIAPEMFYEKKITERIDIFSAGAAFARLFTGVEAREDTGLEAKLSAEEEKELNNLFKKKHLQRLTNKKVLETFNRNFKLFNFYRSCLQKELQNPGLHITLQEIYPLLLHMLDVNPGARPDANSLILQVQDILEKSAIKLETPGDDFVSPVFKIRKTPVTVVNLNKKSTIEIGSIKRKEESDDSGFNHINLRFIDISRHHLQVNAIESPTANGEPKIEIVDLHSKHGVFLNDEKIVPGNPRELNPGDIIQLGSIISFQFTRDQGFCLLKNITQEIKRGNLLWMDKNQVKELPDKETVIILLKKPLYLSLSSFGAGEDTALMIDEEGDLEIKGGPEHTRVNGDIIL